MADDVRVVVNAADMAKVLRDVKEFDRHLSTALRRRIRNAGRMVMADVQEEIRSYPSYGYSTGMRDELAQSLAVRIIATAGSSRQGVRIVSTGRLLPDKKKILARAMNGVLVRHPVFGDRSEFVDQLGMRFFQRQTIDKHKGAAIAEIRAALDEAVGLMK